MSALQGNATGLTFTEDGRTGRHWCELLHEGQAERWDPIREEIDFLKMNYDNMTVAEEKDKYPSVTFHIDADRWGTRRVDFVVQFVTGYPYVAPRARLVLPEGVRPGDRGAFSEQHAAEMSARLRDVVQSTVVTGAPCVMQMVSAVEEAIQGGPIQPSPPVPPVASPQLQPAGPSPLAPPKDRRVARLSVFSLHLLHKCCQLHDQDSAEEATTKFQQLVKYLSEEVELFPPKIASDVNWSPEMTLRAFRSVVSKAMLGEDPLKKWLWNMESTGAMVQQISYGRYQSEFTQHRMLGAGGFAPVFECRKKIDGRRYAIKKIVMMANQSERMLREVQTLAALNHKNIVRYYDAWIEPGCDADLKGFLDEEEEGDSEARCGSDGSSSEGSSSASRTSSDSHGRGGGRQGRHVHLRLPPNVGCAKAERRRPKNPFFSESDESISDDGHCSDDVTGETTSSQSGDDAAYPTESMIDTPYLTSTEKYHTLYIQMELCSARSLRHLIEKADSTESDGTTALLRAENGEKLAASILRQLLTVVSHVHRENIVHRDLKPDNILFEMKGASREDFGTIRVADFGLARTMPESIRRNASSFNIDDAAAGPSSSLLAAQIGGDVPTGNLGSVLYCAPEQERGDQYDFKVDEYSIGMIALEMWLSIAGKGFRDRFNIMSEVGRSGQLPAWFRVWNPSMARIISSLIEREPCKRLSCDDIIQTAELPGEPAEIAEALETIDKHSERITGRVVQRVKDTYIKSYRRPPLPLREASRLQVSQTTADLVEVVGVVALLHMATPLLCHDPLVLLNPALEELSLPYLLDASGRCYVYPFYPQFAFASSMAHVVSASSSASSFYQFYNRSRPFVSYATQCHQSGFDDLVLDPLMFVLHIVSVTQCVESLEIAISHADWLTSLFSRDTDPNELAPEVYALRSPVQTADQVAPAVSRVSEWLCSGKLAPAASADTESLVQRFACAALDLLEVFGLGGQASTAAKVIVDPTLRPSETVVHLPSLQTGLLFELRHTGDGNALAFGCSLENFTRYFTSRHGQLASSMLCVTLDILELAERARRTKYPVGEPLLLDGVGVRRSDQYSQSHFHVSSAVAHLWQGNIRACMSTERDTHCFVKAMKARHARFVLSDGFKLLSLRAFAQQGKSCGRVETIATNALAAAFRSLVNEERAAAKGSKTTVLFTGKEEPYAADEARELFTAVMQPAPGTVLATGSRIADVRRCLHEFAFFSEGGANGAVLDSDNTTAELAAWLRANAGAFSLLPVFSIPDRQLEFLVNSRRFRQKQRRDNGKRKR